MRILIISYYFPPYNSIGAVRVSKIAKYLTKHGHEVRVITAKSQALTGHLPKSLTLEVPESSINYTSWLDVSKIPGKRNSSRTGHIGWLPFAFLTAVRTIKDWSPDIIYASAMPSVALIAAHLSSQVTGVPWVAELRDLWTDNHYIKYSSKRQRFEKWLEKKVLSSAIGHVTVSEPLAEVLAGKFGKPTCVIMNGFDPEDYPTADFQNLSSGPLRIVYTGSIYTGKQDLSPLFEAVKKMKLQAEDINIEFYGSNSDMVNQIATDYQVGNLVKSHPSVPHHEALSLQRNADILLLLLWSDIKEKGVFTGKLFEYIGARRPILAIGPSSSVAADLIEQRKAGGVLSQPEDIALHLAERLQQKRKDGIPALPEDIQESLSREEQVNRLELFLSQLLGTRKELTL